MARMRWFVLLLAGLLLAGCSQESATDRVDDFMLKRLDGSRFYLNQYADRPVVLLFWGTWCVPCKKQMVALKQFQAQHEAGKVCLAAVCVDPENMALVQDAVEVLGLEYPVLLDSGRTVAKRYGVEAVPTTFIIKNGTSLAYRALGFDDTVMARLKDQIDVSLIED